MERSPILVFARESGQQPVPLLRIPDDSDEAAPSAFVPRRVVALHGFHAAVSEQRRNILHRHAGEQQRHGERVGQAVRFEALDTRVSGKASEPRAPVLRGRGRLALPAPPEEARGLAAQRLDRAQDRRRQADRDQLAGLGPAQDELGSIDVRPPQRSRRRRSRGPSSASEGVARAPAACSRPPLPAPASRPARAGAWGASR